MLIQDMRWWNGKGRFSRVTHTLRLCYIFTHSILVTEIVDRITDCIPHVSCTDNLLKRSYIFKKKTHYRLIKQVSLFLIEFFLVCNRRMGVRPRPVVDVSPRRCSVADSYLRSIKRQFCSSELQFAYSTPNLASHVRPVDYN